MLDLLYSRFGHVRDNKDDVPGWKTRGRQPEGHDNLNPDSASKRFSEGKYPISSVSMPTMKIFNC
jgi:hypothetical protein